MIPEAAVEAAAKAYRAQQAELGYPKWEDLPDDGRDWRRDFMRAALEAAAPYMLATAWEQGHFAGSAGKVLEDEYPHLELTNNPYRPTP